MIVSMIIFIDFKICIGAEKNSETIRRILVVCDLEISEAGVIIASKNIIWVDQNIKWIGKTQLLLLTAPYRFKNIFRHNPIYRILHALRFKKAAAAHGGELATNLFDEMYAPALFRIARLGYPWLRLRSRLGPFLVCDRYFHELLFNDLRRAGATPRLREGWEQLALTMPLPAWHLHLDAANDVILGRKRELPAASLDCYRQSIFAIHLTTDTPYFTYLNTGRPLEEVRAVLRLAAAPLGLRFK